MLNQLATKLLSRLMCFVCIFDVAGVDAKDMFYFKLVFDMMDKNGNGVLDFEEVRTMYKRMGYSGRDNVIKVGTSIHHTLWHCYSKISSKILLQFKLAMQMLYISLKLILRLVCLISSSSVPVTGTTFNSCTKCVGIPGIIHLHI